MALSKNTKLGPYEILVPLGAGGMGEVYLARDTRLDRDVAIKVLPEAMTRDKERVARFEREAKLLASLNHPNIASIHGFDNAEGTRFLVMEYVEGETLGQRLKSGPFAIEDALDVAKQMAEALEAAHEKGVIHRDLKPGNVMIRTDGTVKVLDFGLAKAMADEPSAMEQANSPTITANYTRPGVVLGTAAYMSPEQARGRALDKRTDIWSFGIILFECLTGNLLFQGETANDSMGAIMHKEPEWSLLPPSTPPTIQLLLRRCLTKDRKRRLHDIADARVELEAAIVDPTSSSLGLAQTVIESERSRQPGIAKGIGFVVLLLVVGAGAWFAKPTGQSSSPVMRLTFAIPEDETLSAARWPMFDISPDGTRIVYVGRGTSDHQLYLRYTHQLDATLLQNTTGAISPFFSPDGAWIAFAQQGKLKKISVLGGPAETICEASNLRGGSWSVDGTIVFSPEVRSGLWRVSSAGGTPQKLTDAETDARARSHRWPHFLPDGKTVLYTATPDDNNYAEADIVALSLETLKPKVVLSGATFARYAPTGHLLFARLGSLMAVPFDVDSLEAAGEPAPAVEGVFGVMPMGSAQYAFSRAGTLVYLGGTAGSTEELLVWLDRTGQESPLSTHRRDFRDPVFSPDGSKLAARVDDGANPSDIWILEIERDVLMRLTFAEAADTYPVWSPDGQWIVYASDRDGSSNNLYRRRADGTGDVERLTTSENAQRPCAFSPDQALLVYAESRPDTDADIMLLDLNDEERRSTAFLATPFEEFFPSVSPDGKWIAYNSNESGDYEIYVQPFPDGGRRVKISEGLSFRPLWSPDSSEVFYRRGVGSGFMVVPVRAMDDTLQAGTPQEMFDLKQRSYLNWFGVAPDGKRFVFGRNANETEQFRQPTVVVNWFDELEERVPTK